MSDKSPLEAEATGDGTSTFTYFDREWSVPTKRRLSHVKKMRDELQSGFGEWNLLIAETFLPPDQFDALLDIDPDVDELKEFAERISSALTGAGGNS